MISCTLRSRNRKLGSMYSKAEFLVTLFYENIAGDSSIWQEIAQWDGIKSTSYFIVLFTPNKRFPSILLREKIETCVNPIFLIGGCFNSYCTCYFGVIYWECIGHLTKEFVLLHIYMINRKLEGNLSLQKTVPSDSKKKRGNCSLPSLLVAVIVSSNYGWMQTVTMQGTSLP